MTEPFDRETLTLAANSPAGRFTRHTGTCIAILIATACAILVFRESPLGFLAALTDGAVAVAIVAAASLAGLWLVWATGNGDLPVRWQIGLGAGLGLGTLSLGMLWCGLRGWMDRTTWIAILAALGVAGLAALYRLSQVHQCRLLIAPTGEHAPIGHYRWLWLLLIPVITLAILAATVPPGLLWQEEANGYDVLEYHLGVPRDWFFANQITYLDHNVYSNFPMNAEMLYLLSMVLFASPVKAALTAQFISLLQGALAGYVAWLIGRDYSPRVGLLTGLAGAAFPWIGYLGALAYVENGMLFYGLLAAGLCNRAIRDPAERNCFRALLLGAVAGLACGYKYTAIPMIAAPLLALWAALNLFGPRRSVSNAIIPLIIAAAVFAPWAAKNQRMTGNPVFPLAHGLFGSKVWTDAQNQQFIKGHQPLPEETPILARLERLWQRVITDPRFGYVPWIAALAAAAALALARTAQRKPIAIWLAILALQILLWMFTTHLYARFAGLLWIPLVILLATLAAWMTAPRPNQPTTTQPSRPNELGMIICLLGLALYGLAGQGWLWHEYNRHLRPDGDLIRVQGAPELFYLGRLTGFEHLQYINGNGKDQHGLPMNAHLLMVGDARIYYIGRPCDYWVTFSSSPFAQAVQNADGQPGPIMDWLRRRGYTHIWADFSEMQRLSRTYGFAPQVDVSLFQRLEKAGLHRLHEARIRAGYPPYGILYEVPRP